MWFIGVEVEQETSAPPPKKNPGSAPAGDLLEGLSDFNLLERTYNKDKHYNYKCKDMLL